MPRIITNFLESKSNLGKKGNNLQRLARLLKDSKSFIVPETIVLGTSLFKEVIKENGKSDFSKFENININPQITREILNSIRKTFGDAKLVIRSSATCEDSIFFSGSGQYESFLNISTDEEIIKAIKMIYASLNGSNSFLYSKIYNINLKKETMAVLIQKVAPVVKSGVMFSCDPVTDEKKYIIESAKGLGTAVVEGKGNITSLRVDYNDKELITDDLIKNLILVIDKIKAEFGHDVDIEWGIDSLNNIYIFQTRPVIKKVSTFNIEYDKSLVKEKCTAISKGFTIGKIENISIFSQGSILFQNEKYNFNNLTLILGSKGVILKEMSTLSHFANILRELVKPCVFIENFKFDPQKLYVIDAFNENVIEFDSLSPDIKVKFLFDLFKYMIDIYETSFERFNGITKIFYDNKIEQVVFDINEKQVLNYLKENNYKKETIKQSIYTYDYEDKSLITGKSIFRIQVSNGKINIQFKKLDSTAKQYRKEEGIIITFDSLQNAKEFMKSLDVVETGYQERTITKYISTDVIVNIIKWPNCNPYLGIESDNISNLDKFAKENNFNINQVSGMGGKEIFEKLNLSLEKCEFKGK